MNVSTNASSYIERTIDKKTYRILRKNDGTLTSTINNDVVFQGIPGKLFEDANNMSNDMYLNIFFRDSTLRQEYYRLKQNIGNDNKYALIKENINSDNWITLRFISGASNKQVSQIRFDIGTEDPAMKKFMVRLNITDNETIKYAFVSYKNFSYATFQQYKKLIDNTSDVSCIEYLILGLITNILGDYIKHPEKTRKEAFKTSTIIATVISILSLIVVIGLIFWRVSCNKVKKLELQRESAKMKEESL